MNAIQLFEAEILTTPDTFLNQTHFARLGIFHLELGKKHNFWLWEWGRISAPNFGDREHCKVFYVMGKALSGELSCPCDRSCRDFPRANLGPVVGPYFFPNRGRNSQI